MTDDRHTTSKKRTVDRNLACSMNNYVTVAVVDGGLVDHVDDC